MNRDRKPTYYAGWIIGALVVAIAIMIPVAVFLALFRFIGWVVGA